MHPLRVRISPSGVMLEGGRRVRGEESVWDKRIDRL